MIDFFLFLVSAIADIAVWCFTPPMLYFFAPIIVIGIVGGVIRHKIKH